MPTLALLLFGRAPAPDDDQSLVHLGRLTLFSALIGGMGVLQYPVGRVDNLCGAIVGDVLFGAIAGGGLAVVFRMLFCGADRWRRGVSLAHALDAWAALAIYPTCACARGLLIVGALTGGLPGRRVIGGDERVDATTPDWSLTASAMRQVLVTDAQTKTYRGYGGGDVVARVPTETPASWRLLLVPVLIVAGLWWW